MSNVHILLETFLDIPFFLESLSLLENVAKMLERLFSLFKALLACYLVKSLLFLQTEVGLYLTWSRISGDVEEVYI